MVVFLVAQIIKERSSPTEILAPVLQETAADAPAANLNLSLNDLSLLVVIVITFYSPSFLKQETAKEHFGLRVKLLPAHFSTTHGGGFILSL